MKEKYSNAHMRAAYAYANLSYCKRRQVGCVIVKDNTIIAIGYNGTNPGDENICEDEDGLTKPEVIHAEDNSLRKLIRSPHTAIDSTVFITTCPCLPCARRLVDAGVTTVYYDSDYKTTEGPDYLRTHGVAVLRTNIKKQQ